MAENTVNIQSTQAEKKSSLQDLSKRQTIAGTVVNGERQPLLKTDEVQAIIGAENKPAIDAATQEALTAQSRAGTVIDGVRQPDLTTEQRKLIVEYNNSRH